MIVADASVATKWLFREEHTDEALALMENQLRRGEGIAAPHLLPAEMTNVLRKRMLREGLSLPDASRALERFFAIPMSLLPSGIEARESMHHRALALAEAFELPATYDAHYIALAEALGCDLWTDDRRLLRRLHGRLPFVRWIGDYAPTA